MNRLNKLNSLNILEKSAGSMGPYWPKQSEVLFLGEISKIRDGKLYNQKSGATDYLTVGGGAGSYTFQCPNTAPYIAADTDYIWFKTDETPRITTEAELVGYDLQRTPVKYDDTSPNAIKAICILSSAVTGDKLNKLFRDFYLPIEWQNNTNAYGHIKSNRVGQNLWTPESVHEPEVLAYITGLATPLSEGQLTNLDTLVAELKTATGEATLADGFDLIRIWAGETSESSLKNLAKNAHHAELKGTPVPAFAAFEGFTSDGANGYIDNNFILSTEASKYAQNDASFGCYVRTNAAETADEFGTFETGKFTGIIARTAGDTLYYGINMASSQLVTPMVDSRGMLIATRSAANVHKLNKNKTEINTGSVASTALSSKKVFSCCWSNADTPTGFTTRQQSILFFGKYFDKTKCDAIITAFEKYMDANGKGIIA
jgi:hypothetical protein